MSDAKRTRLVEAVETGLSAEDRGTLSWMRSYFRGTLSDEHQGLQDRVADFLDRIPRMIEDRDNELAGAEWEILCLRERAECAERILADALARGQVRQQPDASGDVTIPYLKEVVRAQRREIRRLRGLLDGESHG